MSDKPNASFFARNSSMRDVARWLAFVSFGIAITAVVGRIAGFNQLTSAVSGWKPMTLVSAAAQACLAATLASQSSSPRFLKLMLSISGGLALAVLISYALAGNDMLSPAIGTLFANTRAHAAYTSIEFALSILLLSIINWPLLHSSRPWIRDTVSAAVFMIAFVTLAGYAYSSSDIGLFRSSQSMSVNSGISLLLLAVSTIVSRPETGWAKLIASPGISGKVTRGQLLFVAVGVVVASTLMRASQYEGLSISAALALIVAFTVVPMMWLVLRDGRTLVALDDERAERLRLVKRHGVDLQALEAQATGLEASNAQLVAHAEAATIRSEVRYRLLFESIDAGFCVIEIKYDGAGTPVDFRFVEVNAAFSRQIGLADAAGNWMRELVPGHEQTWFDLYGEVARTGRPARFENQAKSLGPRWFDVYAFRVGGLPGAYVGVLFNDITARRNSELELKAMNETLEQRVEAAVAEREEAQAALRQSQKMEAIGQLTGGVAHDFNNLLTPIIGSLDILIRRDGLGEREQRLVNAALQSAERAKTLVQRLLAFARRQPLQPGPVALGTLVSNMAELVASTSGPQIRIAVDVAPDLPPAIGDVNQLELAILNLCVNARDAMADGGCLTISVAPSLRPPGHPDLPIGAYVRLSVTDDGTGMDDETAARAIEPFFSTKGIGKGTGLGLSMVHGLAMQLGGALTICSKLGQGTQVNLFLRSGDMSSALIAAPSDVPVNDPGGRILVVDDQEQVRMTTSYLLQEMGFTTEECESGSVAELRLTRGDHFDLVVTDHLMPGLSGAELAARLAETRPELPVLVVSGYVDADAMAPGLNFLRKPFRRDELAGAISGAMREHGTKPVGVFRNPL